MSRPKKEVTAVHPVLAHLFNIQDESKIQSKNLSERSNITANKISRARRGLTDLSLGEAMRLAGALGWSLNLMPAGQQMSFSMEEAAPVEDTVWLPTDDNVVTAPRVPDSVTEAEAEPEAEGIIVKLTDTGAYEPSGNIWEQDYPLTEDPPEVQADSGETISPSSDWQDDINGSD